MAATASIVIEVNDAGALTALRGINAEAAKMGPTLAPVQHISEQTFNNIEGGALRSREAAALMREEIGVNIPRALRGVIAQNSMLGPAFSAAFSGLAVLGFIGIVEQAIDKLTGFSAGLAAIKAANEEVMKSIGEANKILMGPQTLEQINQRIQQLQGSTADLNKRLGLTGNLIADALTRGTAGYQDWTGAHARMLAELDREKALLNVLSVEQATLLDKQTRTEPIEILKLENAARLAGLEGIQKINEEESGQIAVIRAEIAKRTVTEKTGLAEIVDAHAKAVAARIALERQLSDQTRTLGNQATLAALTGIDQVREKERQGIEQESLLLQRHFIDQATFDARKLEIESRTDAEIIKLQHDAAVQGTQAVLDAEASASVGRQKIEAEYVAKLHAITMEEETSHIDESEKRVALKIWEGQQLVELERRTALELRAMTRQTIAADTEAAIASAPPWLRANAQIVADYQQRIDRINEMLATMKPEVRAQAEILAARQAADAWTIAFSKMRDDLSSQMQSLFDDITSGNIGQRFKKLFEKMVFDMVATWILGMQGMRAASAGAMGGGGGGILGAVFGSLGLGGIFGGGGGGGSSAGAGGAGGQGGISSLPGVITNFAGGGTGTGSGILGSIFGGGSNSSGGGWGAGGNPIGWGAGAGAATGGIVGSGMSGLLNTIIKKGGIGTKAGQLVAMGGVMLGMDAISRGGPLGMLEGALGGAMTGFEIGSFFGPVGAVVGTIIGAIGGFFAGLFGGGAKERARNKLVADLATQIKTIVDAYNNFQTDLPSATSSLENLRTQVGAQIDKLSGNHRARVDPMIDAAEKQLNATDAERVRRAAIQFGPQQFRYGGFVGAGPGVPPGWSGMAFASGGAVPAILHAGEFVMQSAAVRSIGRGNLESMNAGGGGGGEWHIHIHALDSQSFDGYLRADGGRAIIRAIRRAGREGTT